MKINWSQGNIILKLIGYKPVPFLIPVNISLDEIFFDYFSGVLTADESRIEIYELQAILMTKILPKTDLNVL